MGAAQHVAREIILSIQQRNLIQNQTRTISKVTLAALVPVAPCGIPAALVLNTRSMLHYTITSTGKPSGQLNTPESSCYELYCFTVHTEFSALTETQ